MLTDRDFDENDYDMLLALDDDDSDDEEQQLLSGRSKGVDLSLLSSLPTSIITNEQLKQWREGSNAKEEMNEQEEEANQRTCAPRVDLLTCSICLEEYEEGDEVRRLPCWHAFHAQCIDRWLTHHVECPVCKFEVG